MKIKQLPYILFMLGSFFTSSQEDLFNAATIDDELKTSANAVVRLNDYNITIESQQKMVITLNRVVTVLNEKGENYPQAGVGYDKYRKIKKIEAIIYDASGNEVKKYRKKDFIDHSAVDGGTLYSDSRVLFMNYTPISYPYTVHFTYEIETPNTAGITTWNPIYGYFLSIESNKYSIIDNANLGLRIKEKNFEGFNIEINKSSSEISYTLNNVKALKPEDLSPNLSEMTPVAMVAAENFHFNGVNGKAANWTEFGDWIIDELLEGRNEVTPATKIAVNKLVSDTDDNIEKAKRIYKYVQDNTRYISVQVGIGGIQPISALEVDKLKYGDCKGLSNYTKALLDVVGVPSYYSVVEAGGNIEDFESDFASLEQGNHIILAIPNNDEMLWIDCTSQEHPFGFIGDFTDNRNVLVVKDGESEIMKTVSYLNEENHQKTEARIELNADGSIEGQIVISSQGVQYDNRFGIEEESHKDILNYYKNYWGDINSLEIDNYKFINDRDHIIFTETINLYARNYASVNGDRLIFAANVFNKNTFVPKRYRNRKTPLKVQRGYFDEDEFEISLPQGYSVGTLPEKIDLENKFGSYPVEYQQKEGKIIYERKLLIKHGTYDVEDYETYRKFRRQVSRFDSSLIILTKT